MIVRHILRSISLLLAVTIILTACSTIGKNSGQQQQFHFLFEKNLQTRNVQDCMAAYYRGPLLYFFTSYYNNLYKVTVYNPENGEFAELPVITEGKESCKSLPFTYKEPRRTLWITVAQLQSPSFRRLFDNYRQDPDSLKNAINAIPYLFRQKGLWHGETTARLTKKTLRAHRLQDVVDYFL